MSSRLPPLPSSYRDVHSAAKRLRSIATTGGLLATPGGRPATGPGSQDAVQRTYAPQEQENRKASPKRKRNYPPHTTFAQGFAEGFRMAVPDAFKAALDVKITNRRIDGVMRSVETEGAPPSYSFSAGDAVYDTPLAYQRSWAEALQHVNLGAVVVDGYPDEPTGATKSDGEIAVKFFRPTPERDRLIEVGLRVMTQSAFVAFLRSGEPPNAI